MHCVRLIAPAQFTSHATVSEHDSPRKPGRHLHAPLSSQSPTPLHSTPAPFFGHDSALMLDVPPVGCPTALSADDVDVDAAEDARATHCWETQIWSVPLDRPHGVPSAT